VPTSTSGTSLLNVEQDERNLSTERPPMMTRREDMGRVICCVLDNVSSEMNERFNKHTNFNEKFSCLPGTKSLLASRNDRDQLKRCVGLWLHGCIHMISPASTY